MLKTIYSQVHSFGPGSVQRCNPTTLPDLPEYWIISSQFLYNQYSQIISCVVGRSKMGSHWFLRPFVSDVGSVIVHALIERLFSFTYILVATSLALD